MIKNITNQSYRNKFTIAKENLLYSQYPSDFINSPNVHSFSMKRPVRISANGITYKGTEENGKIIIDNIKVKPGTECVVFDVDGAKNIYFRLSGNYCFNYVKEIHIGKNVREVCIKNSMFPNVNLVTSDNIRFENGRDVLIHDGMLLNSFYKTQDSILDMKGVTAIADFAINRCKAKNVINTHSLKELKTRAFSGYDCFADPETKTKIFGDVIVDIDMNAETIEIPDDRYNIRIVNKLIDSKHNKAIRIHKYKTLKKLVNHKLPNKLIVDIKGDEDEFWEFQSVLEDYYNDSFDSFEIYGSRYFKTYDGILYSADMSNLILCPQSKTGKVNIPDGVKRISENAFKYSKIDEIYMPSSLKSIGKNAFKRCERLHTVSLNQGLEFLGHNAFDMCRQLKKIEIPSSIRVIPDYCFEDSPLEKLILNEGLIEIKESAFRHTQGEIHLPNSLRNIERYNFIEVHSISVNSKVLPQGLLTSVAEQSNTSDDDTVVINYDDTSLCIPKLFMFGHVYDALKVMERLSISDIIDNSDVFLLYISQVSRQDKAALEMYEVTKNEKIKDFLKKRALPYAKSLIEEHDDVRLIRLLKTGAVECSDMEEMLSMLEGKNMVTVTAYILNTIGKRESVDNMEDFKL